MLSLYMSASDFRRDAGKINVLGDIDIDYLALRNSDRGGPADTALQRLISQPFHGPRRVALEGLLGDDSVCHRGRWRPVFGRCIFEGIADQTDHQGRSHATGPMCVVVAGVAGSA